MGRSHRVRADAGTAFDGRLFCQIAGGRIQKVDPQTGDVLAIVRGAYVSGLEYDGEGRFCAGGGRGGRLRVVRRPRGRSAPASHF